MNAKPAAEVTVLLPVYNGIKYLKPAIESILSQTLDNFDFVIIDDGSVDGSYEVVESYSDRRIRFIRQENRGLAATLNYGLSLANTEFIARQDQDDVSHPERLARQLFFMRENPKVALLGTAAEIWIDNTPSGRFHDHPASSLELSFDLLFNNPFVHSSAMLRKAAIESVGGYCTNKLRQPPEDYELWARLVRRYSVANLSERLVIYREVSTSMSRVERNPFLEKVVLICSENIAWANQMDLSVDCTNLAAIVHSAPHLVVGKPNLQRMIGLIDKAATFVEKENYGYLNKKRHARINSIRGEYFLRYQSEAYFYRYIISIASKLKFLINKIRGSTL
jgi:glycosyltransferase involved in cell wall biosynthesis